MRSTDNHSYRQQQEIEEDLQRDAERIFAYLERHIAPSDIPRVRYFFGIVEHKSQWAESEELQTPLFIG